MDLNSSKPVFGGLGITKAQNSAFFIRLLESITCKLALSKMSIFELVSVAEQACLCMTCSQIMKTGFLASRPI